MSKQVRKRTDTALTPAQRAEKLLAYKPLSGFNAPIGKSQMLGTSAAAKARAAI